MKTSLFALASIATAAHSAIAASSLALSDARMPRFLQERQVLEQELAAWKQSAAGAFAKQHDFFLPLAKATHVMTAEEVEEDQLRRFFLTKLHIEQVQAQNPDAVFSTDSPFTLMTDDEFAAFLGKSFARGTSSSVLSNDLLAANVTASVSDAIAADVVLTAGDKDWTTSGCVAAVKDQGQCGSCWAFAAVAALESAYCLKGHPLTLFSEQQVLSCDSVSGGCEGGFPGDALNYIQKTRGICLADAYPYVSGKSQETGTCETSSCDPAPVVIAQVGRVPQSESGLLAALSGRPVAVGVAAGNNTWKQYKSGVVSTCASSQLDHAVLAVGYGGSGTATPFFKIKNSWGETWGESGFIRLKRGVPGAGTCGIVGPKSVYPIL